MARQIPLQCSKEVKDIICLALRNYAHKAFPDASSPCQMVSRDSLLNSANDIEQQFSRAGSAAYSSRMRAMLKAAIKFHFDVIDEKAQAYGQLQYELIMAVCKGEPVTDEQYQLAKQQD